MPTLCLRSAPDDPLLSHKPPVQLGTAASTQRCQLPLHQARPDPANGRADDLAAHFWKGQVMTDKPVTFPMPLDIQQFLMGNGPLEGVWFGEAHPTREGAFWWRTIIGEREGYVKSTRPATRRDALEEAAEVVDQEAEHFMGWQGAILDQLATAIRALAKHGGCDE